MSPQAMEAWSRLKKSQKWAAGAEIPITVHLGRAHKTAIQRMEEGMNLSLPQMRILMEALNPEGVSQATLHKHYKIDPASITRTVQAMERDGLVVRRPDEKDNRFMRVYATAQGHNLAETLPARIANFERKVLQGFSDEEILQLHVYLERIWQNAENITFEE